MSYGAKPQNCSYADLSHSQIRAQLNKILECDLFARSERLSEFLRYVVEETLRGNGGTLKEQVIAHDVYSRGPSYDPNADPIVRVDARRLRDKLREYYAEAPGDSVLITLPKGSYVPSFKPNPVIRPITDYRSEPLVITASRRTPWRKIAGAGAIAFVVVIGGYLLRPSQTPAIRIRPLTSYPGLEGSPSLSPDGNFVVFTWENGAPPDIYVKATDSESLRRLTDTPEAEFSPAWSPDGREIVFVRGRSGVFVMSALGGVERKIADEGTYVAWAADSRSIFLRVLCAASPDVFCVDRIRLDTRQRQRIVQAGANGTPVRGAWAFSASPNGETLAFTGIERPGVSDLYVVSASGGNVRRLTTVNAVMGNVDWTPDGKNLIYSADPGQSGRLRLWRVPAYGKVAGPGEPLTTEQGESAEIPSIARASRGDVIRVAYMSSVRNIPLRLVRMQPAGLARPVGTAVPLADQTVSHDCSGAFSPTGEHYVFRSYRSGEPRLWIIGLDRSDLRPLNLHELLQGRPYTSAWSPDGRQLVVEWVAPDGNNDLYLTELAGGQPVRLTHEPARDSTPAWSPDGHWIYFASDRSGSFRVWKIPAQGGSAIAVSPGFGFEPQASPDGRFIYYSSCLPPTPCPLKRIPTAGGPETVVLNRVVGFSWSVTSSGIYFLSREQEMDGLDLFDPAAGKRKRLGSLPFKPNFTGLFCGFVSVSPDGRSLVGNHVDRFDSNLMLLDIPR